MCAFSESGLVKPPLAQSLTGYLWTDLAVLASPCHLPLIIGALAGTTAGALLSAHWVLGLAGFIALFLVSAAQAWRSCPEVRVRARVTWRREVGLFSAARAREQKWSSSASTSRGLLL